MGAETHILALDDSVPREMARAAWRAWLRPRDFGVLTWLLWGGTVLTIIVLLLPTSSRWWASRAFAVATLVQPLFAIGALMAWLQSGRGWARVEDLALVPRAGGLWVLANVRALGLVLAIQALTLGVAVAWILRDSMLTNDADTFYAFIVFIGGFVVSGGCGQLGPARASDRLAGHGPGDRYPLHPLARPIRRARAPDLASGLTAR